MSRVMVRCVGGAVSVVVAAGCGVATNLATEGSAAIGWWAALGVLVVLGVLVQVFVTLHDDTSADALSAFGDGAVAIGRDNDAAVTTAPTTSSDTAAPPGGSNPPTGASGAGSVVIGRDNRGEIRTGDRGPRTP